LSENQPAAVAVRLPPLPPYHGPRMELRAEIDRGEVVLARPKLDKDGKQVLVDGKPVIVTINSDDPPMFSTDINREYAIAAELLDLDEIQLGGLAKDAVEVSFAPPEVKLALRTEIDSYVAGYLVAQG